MNGTIIDSIDGGANNLVYRARDSNYDYAVKFTIKDKRKRASREFVALRALRKFGLEIAPQAILLDEDSFSQPVVVQTWMPGQRMTAAPNSQNEWQKVISHFASIHSFKQTRIEVNTFRMLF